MYKEALGLNHPGASSESSPASPLTDRILITRILSPAFEDCDVFFPEFREQKRDDGSALWMQASQKDLEDWVGSEVPEDVQEEKGVKYEFQMWSRTA